jgi:hypothetical protein
MFKWPVGSGKPALGAGGRKADWIRQSGPPFFDLQNWLRAKAELGK